MKAEYDDLFRRIAGSKFRSGFSLRKQDVEYIRKKGLNTIRSHAEDFISQRLAPGYIPNDGKQTPMRGHPVFPAQHATGCCCRGCLKKWHGIEPGKRLTELQQEYVVDTLMEWIDRQLELAGIDPKSVQEPAPEEKDTTLGGHGTTSEKNGVALRNSGKKSGTESAKGKSSRGKKSKTDDDGPDPGEPEYVQLRLPFC